MIFDPVSARSRTGLGRAAGAKASRQRHSCSVRGSGWLQLLTSDRLRCEEIPGRRWSLRCPAFVAVCASAVEPLSKRWLSRVTSGDVGGTGWVVGVSAGVPGKESDDPSNSPWSLVKRRSNCSLKKSLISFTKKTSISFFFFLFQQLHTLEKDLVSACDLLGVGAEYARVVGSEYTR